MGYYVVEKGAVMTEAHALYVPLTSKACPLIVDNVIISLRRAQSTASTSSFLTMTACTVRE